MKQALLSGVMAVGFLVLLLAALGGLLILAFCRLHLVTRMIVMLIVLAASVSAFVGLGVVWRKSMEAQVGYRVLRPLAEMFESVLAECERGNADEACKRIRDQYEVLHRLARSEWPLRDLEVVQRLRRVPRLRTFRDGMAEEACEFVSALLWCGYLEQELRGGNFSVESWSPGDTSFPCRIRVSIKRGRWPLIQEYQLEVEKEGKHPPWSVVSAIRRSSIMKQSVVIALPSEEQQRCANRRLAAERNVTSR